MTVRKRKKKNKLRGQRTHGKGDTKNKRGSGNKGGKGRAGSHKHKFTKYYGFFGSEKKRIIGKPKLMSVNLDDIQKLVPVWEKENKVEKRGKAIFLDGKIAGIGKVLGRGSIDFPLFLKNVKVSSKAIVKIEKADGKIMEAGEEGFEEEDADAGMEGGE